MNIVGDLQTRLKKVQHGNSILRTELTHLEQDIESTKEETRKWSETSEAEAHESTLVGEKAALEELGRSLVEAERRVGGLKKMASQRLEIKKLRCSETVERCAIARLTFGRESEAEAKQMQFSMMEIIRVVEPRVKERQSAPRQPPQQRVRQFAPSPQPLDQAKQIAPPQQVKQAQSYYPAPPTKQMAPAPPPQTKGFNLVRAFEERKMLRMQERDDVDDSVYVHPDDSMY